MTPVPSGLPPTRVLLIGPRDDPVLRAVYAACRSRSGSPSRLTTSEAARHLSVSGYRHRTEVVPNCALFLRRRRDRWVGRDPTALSPAESLLWAAAMATPGPVVNRPKATSGGLWPDSERLLQDARRLTGFWQSRADGTRVSVLVAAGRAWILVPHGAGLVDLSRHSVELAAQLGLDLVLLGWIRAGDGFTIDLVDAEPTARIIGDRMTPVAGALAGVLLP